MNFSNAIVRQPGINFADGITTQLQKPDYKKALFQHTNYCKILEKCGLKLIILKPDLRYSDAEFVEDTAIITGKMAIITKPGNIKRRNETNEIKNILADFKKNEQIIFPGTVDGGDILQIEDHFYLGHSDRTNLNGIEQLKSLLLKYDYTSSIVEVDEILHLKSGVNYLGNGVIIIQEKLKDLPIFNFYKKIIVSEDEKYSANCLNINGKILIPKGYHDTKEKLIKLNNEIIELEMSEFMKMDGGLTCLSLRF